MNGAKELYGRAPTWAKVLLGASGPQGLALVLTGEMGFDILGGAAGLVGADAETFGRLAEGRYADAARGHVASRIGMATHLLPATLTKLGGRAADWLERKGVPAGALPRELWAMREGSKLIEQFQSHGRRLDKEQFERGAAAAPLVDEILMLPLNFIGMGTPRAVAQGARQAARALAKPGVVKVVGEAAEQGARELGWVARNLPRVNAAADWAIHGQLSRVSTRAHDWTARQANRLGFNVCFAAETPMRTATGSIRAADIRPGVRLLSRSEYDPDGPVEEMDVEEVFVREGLICLLTVMGRTIRSTSEHPFYVQGKGWAPLNRIRAGDRIWTEVSGWVTVDAVEETGQWETVYNFRIAQHHTYFVGDVDWGFSLWAHNTTTCLTGVKAEWDSFRVWARGQGYTHQEMLQIWRNVLKPSMGSHEEFHGVLRALKAMEARPEGWKVIPHDWRINNSGNGIDLIFQRQMKNGKTQYAIVETKHPKSNLRPDVLDQTGQRMLGTASPPLKHHKGSLPPNAPMGHKGMLQGSRRYNLHNLTEYILASPTAAGVQTARSLLHYLYKAPANRTAARRVLNLASFEDGLFHVLHENLTRQPALRRF